MSIQFLNEPTSFNIIRMSRSAVEGLISRLLVMILILKSATLEMPFDRGTRLIILVITLLVISVDQFGTCVV